MGERELREKYGGKLAKAINRAIRAEVPARHVDRAFSDDIASMRRLIASPLFRDLVGPLL